MINATQYEGKTLAVIGLARTGIVSALSLQKGGAEVHAWDDDPQKRQEAQAQGINVVDIRDADVSMWQSYEALVLSPGIPHALPQAHWSAVRAQEAGIPIICDIEIFAKQIAARALEHRPMVIAITGTNGKSTTTALLGHIFKQAGRNVEIGGNFGKTVLSLPPLDVKTVYVLELSSFQLERVYSLCPQVAILLNLSVDHLDRHGNMEAYLQAKLRVFANQTSTQTAIINIDDEKLEEVYTQLRARNNRKIMPISNTSVLTQGAYVCDGKLFYADGNAEPIVDLTKASALEGAHNWQNAMAATAAARAGGISNEVIAFALLNFSGLAHRMQIVGRVGNVKYVNDSKATNAEASLFALRAYDEIYWIAGGVAKEGGIESLAPVLNNVKRAYLIGEAAAEFKLVLDGYKTSCKIAEELRVALVCATRDARRSRSVNPVILLSPACASFDQFSDFEERGQHFCTIVDEITAYLEEESEIAAGFQDYVRTNQ